MTRVIINDNNTNRTAPQQPRHRCPEGLEAYKAVPRPVAPIRKPEIFDPLEEIAPLSPILNSPEGQKLGKSPLDFLSKELSKFTSADEIFATRNLLPRTKVADDFHKACDNVPNVLVIIKSGQYIAGGYTEVPFESREFKPSTFGHFKVNEHLTTFVFSVNRQKVYPLKDKRYALNCDKHIGPTFGEYGLRIADDHRTELNVDDLFREYSTFESLTAVAGELCGTRFFAVDEYEVFQLI